MTALTDVQAHYIALELTKYAQRHNFPTAMIKCYESFKADAEHFFETYKIGVDTYLAYVVEILISNSIRNAFSGKYTVGSTYLLNRPFGQHPDFGKIALILIEQGTSKVCQIDFARDRESIANETGIDASQIDAFFYRYVYKKT